MATCEWGPYETENIGQWKLFLADLMLVWALFLIGLNALH
jgi:hypothetical protein